MAVVELDPVFVKALKLLQSKSKDSAEKLKQMHDEAVALKKAKSKEKLSSGDSDRSSSHKSSSSKHDEEKKREAEKRQLEKLKNEINDLSSDAKRPKLETPHNSVKEEKKDHSSDRERKDKKEKEREHVKKEKIIEEKKEVTSDSEDNKNLDADEFAFDLGISCSICRSFDVSSGNQLVECLECHNLYHQECHKPAITDQEVNDPRCVWYCSRCSKSLKKMQVAKPTKAKVSLSVGSTKDSESSSSKTSKSPPTANPFQFRRSENKLSSSKDTNNGSTAKPMSGFESLAANLSGKNILESQAAKAKIEQLKQMTWSSKSDHKSSSKSEHSGSGSKSDTPSSKASKSSSSSSKPTNWGGSVAMAAINAEKKLQFVKKRAAMKITDKKHYK